MTLVSQHSSSLLKEVSTCSNPSLYGIAFSITHLQQVTFTPVKHETGSSMDQHAPPHPHHNPHQQPHHNPSNPHQQHHHSQSQQCNSLGYFVIGDSSQPCSSAPGTSSTGSHIPLTPIGHELTPRSSRAREAKVIPYIPKSEPSVMLPSHHHPSVERIKATRSPRPDVSAGFFAWPFGLRSVVSLDW